MDDICIGKLQRDTREIECPDEEKRFWFGTFYIRNAKPLIGQLFASPTTPLGDIVEATPWSLVEMSDTFDVVFNVRIPQPVILYPGWHFEDPSTILLIFALSVYLLRIGCGEVLYLVSDLGLETGHREVISCSLMVDDDKDDSYVDPMPIFAKMNKLTL